MHRRSFLLTGAGFAALVLTPGIAVAGKAKVYMPGGAGASGYDVVAYFTESRPVKGDLAISVSHDGAKWYFASEDNRQAFLANPAKHAPQYGGYCAFAVSQGYTASTDPEAWTVHDGKLYLNYSKGVRSRWERDVPGYISLGNRNWPAVLN